MSTTGTLQPRLRLLGHFALAYGATTVDIGTSAQRLLAYLALYRHGSRAVVAGTLWPDVTEERAHGSLRTALWRLHQGREPLVHSDGGALSLTEAVSVDVHDLTASALQVIEAPVPPVGALSDLGCRRDPAEPSKADRDLFFTGELLPNWDEDWILFERERLRQLRLHALEALAHRLAAEGRYALALEAALEGVRIEPLRESAHRAVAAVHLAEHNVQEAVRHYRAFHDLVHDELGIGPSPAFTSMLPSCRLTEG